MSDPAKQTDWLMPALGFAGAATTAGLLTSKKQRGESARERARRVIVNAVGAGLLGGGGVYALGKAKDDYVAAGDPNTGNPDGDPSKKPGVFSSLLARLGYTGAFRSLSAMTGRNGVRNLYSTAPIDLLPSQVRGVTNDPWLDGRSNVVSPAAKALQLETMEANLNPKAQADLAKRNILKLKDVAARDKGLGGLLDVMGVARGGTEEAEAIRKLNRQGTYAVGKGSPQRGLQAWRSILHGAENLVGSSGRHSPASFAGSGRMARFGVHGGGLAAAFMLPDILRSLGNTVSNANQDTATNFITSDFPTMGKPPEVKTDPKGFLHSLLTQPFGKEYPQAK